MIERIGASADDIAIAVVSACRFTRENPIAVIRRAADDVRDNLGRAASSRAGFLALAALCRVYPDLKVRQCTRALGWHPSSAGDAAGRGLTQAKRGRWWSEALVDRVVASIIEHRRSTKQEIIDLPAMPSRRQEPSKLPTRRIIDHRVFGAVDLGDPPPGRSALDQRRAAEAAR